MVCLMCELLELEEGHKVLEIGTGSGYHAALIAELVAGPHAKGHVYTMEIIKELADFARRNLEKLGYLDRVTVIRGDGSLGYPKAAPYDRILVTAAAPSIPKPLVDQLKIGGIIVAPVGPPGFSQILVRARKRKDGLSIEEHGYVAFVPLRGKRGWRGWW